MEGRRSSGRDSIDARGIGATGFHAVLAGLAATSGPGEETISSVGSNQLRVLTHSSQHAYCDVSHFEICEVHSGEIAGMGAHPRPGT